MKKLSKKSKIFLGLGITSIVLLIVSLVLAFKVFPDVIASKIHSNVELEEGTEQYDRFMELPFPIQFKINIFNVTNANEILNNGAKPKLTEIGPFVYSQTRKKNKLFTNSKDDTISYTQDLEFSFNEEASGDLTPDTQVTIINPPYLVLLQEAEKIGVPNIAFNCTRLWFGDQYNSLFIKIKVHDLLFKGINFLFRGDPLCDTVATVVFAMAQFKKNIDLMDDGTLLFSVLNYKIKEPDGQYTVNRGIDDVQKLGEITRFDNLTFTEFWKGDNTSCDKIEGRDSTIYSPDIKDDAVFKIYTTDLCRVVSIYASGEGTYKDINGLKLTTKEDTWYSQTTDPKDDCFCIEETWGPDGTPTCYLDGVLDIYNCLNEPVLASFPHFYGADQKYRDAIDGMKPDPDLHSIFILIEPNTGTPLQGAKRLQLNLVSRPITNVVETQGWYKAVFPFVWFEEGISLPDKYIDDLNSQYFSQKSLVDGIQWSLVGIFSVLTVIFCGLFINFQCR